MSDLLRKITKRCEKCLREIPYLKAFNGGQEFRCPICGKIVEYNKCILINDNTTTYISGAPPPLKILKKKEEQLSLCLL